MATLKLLSVLSLMVIVSLQLQHGCLLSGEDSGKPAGSTVYHTEVRAEPPKQTRRQPVTVNATKHESHDDCLAEFYRVNTDQLEGLTQESLQLSRASIGNQERFRKLARKLIQQDRPIRIAVFGGSITVGHGVVPFSENNQSGFYRELLPVWMNKFYPLPATRKHEVKEFIAHGANICHLTKRLNFVVESLARQQHDPPDIFILEFAVNDYQGQDDLQWIDFKTDIFFEGFQDLALCAETVIYNLARTFPDAVILFLEFQTAIRERKTSQTLHMAVAQHYGIPVISYADAMFHEYTHLLSLMNSTEYYTVPVGEPLLPYPFGCAPCNRDTITNQFLKLLDDTKSKYFNAGGCRSVCEFTINQEACRSYRIPLGREHCHFPLFAHDEVHPSAKGHKIAADLLIHAITMAGKEECQNKPYSEHYLPTTGWLAPPKALVAYSDYLLVNDTKHEYLEWNKLTPSYYTAGWSYKEDVPGKPGWIATDTFGNETIMFEIDLPEYTCYSVHVAILKSYVGMGQIRIEVEDLRTSKVTWVDEDGLWKPRISVWSDIQVTKDDVHSCTGRCTVKVQTKPIVEPKKKRGQNKVKILTLSVRRCIEQ